MKIGFSDHIFSMLIVAYITIIFTFNVLPSTVELIVSPMTAVYGTVVPSHDPVATFRSGAGRGKAAIVNAAILVPLPFSLCDDSRVTYTRQHA
jgi:hypothetical protein